MPHQWVLGELLQLLASCLAQLLLIVQRIVMNIYPDLGQVFSVATETVAIFIFFVGLYMKIRK